MSTKGQCMLTTVDNPFNPFTQFDQWFMYDVEKGYDSCGYIGRIAHMSDELTEDESTAEIERAIDEILKYDFTNMRMKIYSNTETV